LESERRSVLFRMIAEWGEFSFPAQACQIANMKKLCLD
jgi:hypothetical protein